MAASSSSIGGSRSSVTAASPNASVGEASDVGKPDSVTPTADAPAAVPAGPAVEAGNNSSARATPGSALPDLPEVTPTDAASTLAASAAVSATQAEGQVKRLGAKDVSTQNATGAAPTADVFGPIHEKSSRTSDTNESTEAQKPFTAPPVKADGTQRPLGHPIPPVVHINVASGPAAGGDPGNGDNNGDTGNIAAANPTVIAGKSTGSTSGSQNDSVEAVSAASDKPAASGMEAEPQQDTAPATSAREPRQAAPTAAGEAAAPSPQPPIPPSPATLEAPSLPSQLRGGSSLYDALINVRALLVLSTG